MDSKMRKTLKNSIMEFYKLHNDKGKLYMFNAWKNVDWEIQEPTI